MPECRQSWQRKEINTQPPAALQSTCIEFAVVRSMFSNSQEVLAEERNTAAGPPSDLHGPRGTVRPERVTLILPPPARCQPLLCLSTSSIFLSPCLSFATATGRAKASILVSLPSVLKHGGYIYVDRDTSHPDWYSGLVTRYAKGYCI